MADIEYPQRVAPLPAAQRSAWQAELVARTGSELSVFTTLVRSPDVFADFLPFGTRLLSRSTLDPRERELLILRAARRRRAPSGYFDTRPPCPPSQGRGAVTAP
jgi:4-carboxymuconolactone decarboxylase